MNEIRSIFSQIGKLIRTKENYVPRDYQTVGGMWTVDTYKKGGITAQLMDEGWTLRIFSSTIDAIDSGGHFTVTKGTKEDFTQALDSLSISKEANAIENN